MYMDWGSCVSDGDVATISCIVPLVINFIQAVVAFGGVALFVMLIVGGFRFLTSGGDPKKLEGARGTVTQAIAGIVIMSLAYLIILTIQNFTGITTLTNFEFPDTGN